MTKNFVNKKKPFSSSACTHAILNKCSDTALNRHTKKHVS